MSKPANDRNHRIPVIDDNPAIHDDFRKILARSTETGDFEAIIDELFGADAAKPALTGFEFESAFSRSGRI